MAKAKPEPTPQPNKPTSSDSDPKDTEKEEVEVASSEGHEAETTTATMESEEHEDARLLEEMEGERTEPPINRRPTFSNESFRGRVVIEVGDDRNRNFLWNPTQDLLRGAWRRENLRSGELNRLTEQIPSIPGIRIEIDGRRRICRIYDPLNNEGLKPLLERIQRGVKSAMNSEQGPERDKVYQDCDDTTLKTWLYWARRLVNGTPRQRNDEEDMDGYGGPQAKVIEGLLPTLREIERLAGKTTVSQFDSALNGGRFREDPLPRIDEEDAN